MTDLFRLFKALFERSERFMMSEGTALKNDEILPLWLGGAAVTGPLAARAQQTKAHVIGISGAGHPDPAHFVARLVREELAKPEMPMGVTADMKCASRRQRGAASGAGVLNSSGSRSTCW